MNLLESAPTAPGERVTARRFTLAAFEAFVNLPENAAKSFELIDGVAYEMPSPTPVHGWIVARLIYLLMNFVVARKLGDVFSEVNDFILAPGLVLQSDVSFVAAGRIRSLYQKFDFAPDIAIEVVSPSNLPHVIAAKVEAYLQHGSHMVIALYPEDRTVRVFTPAPQTGYQWITLHAADTLTGGAVLPGFAVPVRDLFPPDEIGSAADESNPKATPHDE
ncbi:MAG: Uma2 family endonuclease [bacterium]|nr:Uma2 family endonuclease [bacterium]